MAVPDSPATLLVMLLRATFAATLLLFVANAGAAPGDAPDFDLKVLQGPGPGSSTELRGKVVLIEFWATYCGWCRSTHPRLKKVAKAHKDTITVLGISWQRLRRLRKYLRKHRLGFTVLHDKRARVAEAYGVTATPSVAVIDAGGKLIFAGVGLKAVDKAIKKAKAAASEAP